MKKEVTFPYKDIMNAEIIPENKFNEFKEPIPEGLPISYFKITSIGQNTIKATEGNANKICDMMQVISGYFLVGDNTLEIREGMHSIVDKFCDAYEEQIGQTDESEN